MACGTGVLCPGGAPAMVAGAAVAAHGAVVAGAGAVMEGQMLAYMRKHSANERSNAGLSNKQSNEPLQTGGHVINNSTAKSLGLTRQEANDAMHALKKDLSLPNDFHGKIMSNGDVVDPHSGDVLGNIFHYVH